MYGFSSFSTESVGQTSDCPNSDHAEPKGPRCRPPRPIRHQQHQQRSASVSQANRLSEYMTNETGEDELVKLVRSESTKPGHYPLRRPRTPTLGRVALFARVSYLNKSSAPNGDGVENQRKSTEWISYDISHSAVGTEIPTGLMSRSSSTTSGFINLYPAEDTKSTTNFGFNNRQTESPNQTLISNTKLQSRIGSQNIPLPAIAPQRSPAHTYDSVPMDKLEILKSCQPTVPIKDPTSSISKRASLTLPSNGQLYNQDKSSCSETEESQMDDLSIQSAPNYEVIELEKRRSYKDDEGPGTLRKFRKGQEQLQKQTHYLASLVKYDCTTTMNEDKTTKNQEVIETSEHKKSQLTLSQLNEVQTCSHPTQIPVRCKASRQAIPTNLPTSPKPKISTKSRVIPTSTHSNIISSNLNKSRTSDAKIHSLKATADHLHGSLLAHSEAIWPRTASVNKSVDCEANEYEKKTSNPHCGSTNGNKNDADDRSNGGMSPNDIGWVGPITLRRRAKPELENEKHKDVSLRISIQEVKQLPSKGRYFCEICLDRTLYARTTSKPFGDTVFWGEQFELNNLPSISIITINLFKQANSAKDSKRQKIKTPNQFISFVTIPVTDLTGQSELQQWFPMQSSHSHPAHGLADNLHSGPSNGFNFNLTDPKFMHEVANKNSPLASRFRKRSTPASCFRYNSSSASFSSTPNCTCSQDDRKPSFFSSDSTKKKISWSSGFSSEANGQTNLLHHHHSFKYAQCHSEGFQTPNLSPSSNSTSVSFILPENSFPQLRLKIHYEALDILPLNCYWELRRFVEKKSVPLIHHLEPNLSAKQKEELANCFINIHEKLPDTCVDTFLSQLLEEELAAFGSKESMILRSNSTGSKAIESYIKLVGTEFLHKLLNPVIEQLFRSDTEFEIDPSRLTVGMENGSTNSANNTTMVPQNALWNKIERNKIALIKFVTSVWRRIQSSASFLPIQLRKVFSTLGSITNRLHGLQTTNLLISSCLFLRFICPAIHGPILFGLANSIPENERVSRNLTLVAKLLQNLANLTLFEDKEAHMKILNPFLEQEIPKMQLFLQTICSPNLHRHNGPDDDDNEEEEEEEEGSDDNGGEHGEHDDGDDREKQRLANCHDFIDLGYEYAKLTSLLNEHLPKITCYIDPSRFCLMDNSSLLVLCYDLPWKREVFPENLDIIPEIEELPQILKNIMERTDDCVFAPWDSDLITGSHFHNPTGRGSSSNLSINTIPIPNQSGQNSQFQNDFSSKDAQNSSNTSDSRMRKPKFLIESKPSVPSTVKQHLNVNALNQTSHKHSLAINSTKDLPIISSTPISCTQHHSQDLKRNHHHNQQPKHQVIHQYYSSPSCSCTPTIGNTPIKCRKHSENMEDLLNRYREQMRELSACINRVDLDSSNSPSTSSSKSYRDCPLRAQSGSESDQTTKEVSDSYLYENCTLIQTPKSSKPDTHKPDLHLSSTNETTKGVQPTGTSSMAIKSEYDFDCQTSDTPRAGSAHLDTLSNTQSIPGRSKNSNDYSVNGLSESPSFDQLVERLQESGFATETSDPKQSDNDCPIAKLDRITHPPKFSSHHIQTGDQKFDPRSNHSAWSFTTPLSNPIPRSLNTSTNPIIRHNEVSCDHPQPNIPQTELPTRVNHTESHRSRSFRTKTVRNEQSSLMSGCKTPSTNDDSPMNSNLLYLSKASETMGISLGDLIDSKRSVNMRRRFSESKLIRN